MFENILEEISKRTGVYPIILIVSKNYKEIAQKIINLNPNFPSVDLQSASSRVLIQRQPKRFAELYKSGVLINGIHRHLEWLEIIADAVSKSKEGPYLIFTPRLANEWLEVLNTKALKIQVVEDSEIRFSQIKGISFKKNDLFSYGPEWILRNKNGDLNPQIYFRNLLDSLYENEFLPILQVRRSDEFFMFLGALASSNSQVINYSALAHICGVSVNSILNWTKIVEELGLIYRLHNYHEDYGKRLIKHPKIYFHNPGLAQFCVKNFSDKSDEEYASQSFENVVINEMRNTLALSKSKPEIRFWQDHKARGICSILETPKKLILTDITYKSLDDKIEKDVLRYLKLVKKLSQSQRRNCYIIHSGSKTFKQLYANVLSWQDL